MNTLRRLILLTTGRIGRRGAFLLFLALLDFAYGYSLFQAPIAEVRHVDLLLPWHVWAVIWTFMGAVVLTGVPVRNDRIQYTLAAAFKTAWGLLYLELWIAQGVSQAWVAAVIWLAFAATVLLIAGWPESATATVTTTTKTTTKTTDITVNPGTELPGDNGEH